MLRIPIEKYILVSIGSGILFAVLDGLVNANPLAQELYIVYGPIARSSVDMTAGVIIDLVYGFVLAAMFLLLYKSLPGKAGVAKGLSFGLLVWFLRVLMGAVSSWMMLELPYSTLVYQLLAGLAEMLVLGVVYGLAMKSKI